MDPDLFDLILCLLVRYHVDHSRLKKLKTALIIIVACTVLYVWLGIIATTLPLINIDSISPPPDLRRFGIIQHTSRDLHRAD